MKKIFNSRHFKDELLRGSLILIVTLGLFNLLNYVFQMSMARMLKVEDYGILAALMSIVYIFGIPSEAIQTVISRYTSKFNIKNEKGKMKDLLFRSMRKASALLILFFICFAFLSLFLEKFLNIEFYLFIITGLVLFGSFILPVTRGILQGRKKFSLLGWNLVFESSFKIIISVLLVLFGLKVYGAMAGVVAGVVLAFFLSLFSIKEVVKSRRKREDFRGVFFYNLPSLVAITSIVLMYSLDIILARRFFPPEIAGQYSFVSLIGKAIVFVNIAIGKAMFPISSERFEKGGKTSNLLKKSMAFVALISFLALFFYFFFPEFVVKVISLGSDKYLPASNVLFILGLAFTFTSLANISILYNLSINRMRVSSFFLLIFVLIEVLLLSIFNSSLKDFAISLLVANALLFVYSIVLTKR